jgi:polyphosphate kinase
VIERRFDVVSAEQLEQLASEDLPLGLEGPSTRVLYRDLYIDTDDDQLQRQGISCRLRLGSDDRRVLTLFVGAPNDPAPPKRYEASVDTTDPRMALASGTEPARRLTAIIDTRLLLVRLELQIERVQRSTDSDLLGRKRLHLMYDRVHVRSGATTRAFHHLTVRGQRRRRALFDRVTHALEKQSGLRSIVAGTPERAQLLLKWMEREERGRASVADAGAILVLTREHRFAMFHRGETLAFPFERGSGVGVARTLLDRCTNQAGSDCRLVGKVSSIGPLPQFEVWTAELSTGGEVSKDMGEAVWLDLKSALALAGTIQPDALAAIAVATRSGLVTEGRVSVEMRRSVEVAGWGLTAMSAEGEAAIGDPHFLNSELSILNFTGRVLALAEDLRTPLAERMRYLSIVSENLDEFYMVRVAGIKRSAQEQAEERTPDGLSPRQQLDLISLHAQALVARQYRCYNACAAEAAAFGARIVVWNELDVGRRDQLRALMRDELLPALTPMAMTLSPGHPFPRLRHLSLSLAVVLLDRPGSAPHFAQVELPHDSPRFTRVPGMNAVIAIEELVRGNLDLLYPTSVVEQAYAFRVTRGADLEIEEDRDRGPSLLQVVEEASRRRFEQPVVRVEVERSMPAVLRDVVLRELRREHGGAALDNDDVYEVDGPLDLASLNGLPMMSEPTLCHPKFKGNDPLATAKDIWSAIDERDRLYHHPFDSFDATVVRFFREAAADPLVTAIKMTVYRAGEKSPILAALIDAAAAGKDVVAFFELKARFDEERNVGWAKRLEQAGGRVVYGIQGVKVHAKVALVVRRDGRRLKRYVHVGTGNYNADSAKRYTDLSMFTTDEDTTADVQDLFNELTGSSRAPTQLSRGCLISPTQLLPELLSKIEREAAHARAGRGGQIRMKLNGLSDPDVVQALFRASQDGVKVDLVVRSVCTLRPGIPGMSENIRIVSVLGRFLEHARMYRFANAGKPEYYIGSADLRPRNLRRRVELFAPVKDRACRAQIDTLLDTYLSDASAWELTSAGEYLRGHAGGASAQDQLMSDLAALRI